MDPAFFIFVAVSTQFELLSEYKIIAFILPLPA